MNRRLLKRVKDGYSTGAIILMNTVIVFVVLNLGLYGAFYVREMTYRTEPKRSPDDGKLFNSDGSPAATKKRSSYQLRWFDYSAYGGIPKEYVSDVLDDFYDLSRLGFIFQPWVQFSEPEFKGKLVHVDHDARGFPIRRTVNPRAEALPVAHIFVLGGSTTFGYNVSDEHTWSSYLSAILNDRAKGIQIEVTNYGRGYFNPSQEAILLADLLKSGHRPSLVVFMDGVNTSLPTDVPHFTDKATEGFRKMQFPPRKTEQFEWMPVIRVVNSLRHRLMGGVGDANISQDVDIETRIRVATNAFRQSRDIARAIAALYEVPTLFFLQPSAAHNYDLSLYRLTLPQLFLDERRFAIGIYGQLKNDSAYINLTGLFDEWGHRKAIIDDVHYSPAFNQFLAQRVAQCIDVQSLMPRLINEKAATGVPRSKAPDSLR